MVGPEIQSLIQILSKLPGLGPRSGRRLALHLLKKQKDTMRPLIDALIAAEENIRICSTCGNYDTQDPCALCEDSSRSIESLCVVEDVADIWAMERTGSFRGQYHVLGGTLSALDGRGPEALRLRELISRVDNTPVQEVILALGATVEGQTTAHYITDLLEDRQIRITALAHGVPVGGELDYLDDGTLTTAYEARRTVTA